MTIATGAGAPNQEGAASVDTTVNGSNNNSPGSGAQEQVTVGKDYLAKLFSSGMNERDTRILESLKTLGYTGDKAKLEEALTEFVTGLKTPAKKDNNNSDAKVPEELETLRLQLAEEKKAREAAEADKHTYIGDTELTTALADQKNVKLADGALTPAKILFNSMYTIKRNSEGAIRVYQKNGEIVRNEKFEAATVKEVAAKLLVENPYFVQATVKGRGSIAQNRSGQSGDFMDQYNNASPADKMKMARELRTGKAHL